ncbi:MAG: polysulfide reductase NrfD [Eggerthellaceae bacterium]|nr:polysulfide reductase NrfD [Eggerthellaceae bacterium]
MEKRMRIVGIAGLGLLVLGLIGWALQLTGGLLAGSGMTNIFLWGLMIALFAFMVGFGAGSQIVASVIYITGKEELMPIARTAAAVGLACVGAAGVAILADLGAVRNILFMMVGLNLSSPLAWDMIAMTAFIIVSVVQLVMVARRSASAKIWAILAGVCAVVLQVIEGLLFSLQTSHAWWATPIMPVDFLVVAVVSGSALMLLLACVKGMPNGATRWLSMLCAAAVAVHLALALADLAMVALESTPVFGGVLAALGQQIVLYLAELLLPAAGMVILFVTANKPGTMPKLIAAILVICGIFAHRLMLLYPAYNAPSLYLTLSSTDAVTGPYAISTGRYLDWDQTFALGTSYFPAPAEWLAGLLPFGVAIVATIVILWAMKRISKTS